MAIEDTFSGAKNAFVFYQAFVNTVAQEIGRERASASPAGEEVSFPLAVITLYRREKHTGRRSVPVLPEEYNSSK